MKFVYASLLLFLFIITLKAQTGELDRFDCNYSKEITVPFNYSENKATTKPNLNQVVFYSYRDQFTYWYKITAKIDETITFNVSAINDSDSYAVYTYQYNNTDFCKKLYYQKIKPLSTPFYVGLGSEQKTNHTHTLSIKKDNIYYISILNTSLNNCGHYFKLSSGTDTLQVKAFHTPCKKDVTVLPIVLKSVTPIKKIKDSIPVSNIKVPTTKTDTLPKTPITKKEDVLNGTINIVVKNKQTQTLLSSHVSITDTDSKDEIQLTDVSLGEWQTILENNKTYKLKCTAFGYLDLQMTVSTKLSSTIELFLEPLKVGDNFIMKSIYFHPNTYALRKESADELQRLLTYLIANPTISIEIQGHTNGDNKIYINKLYEALGEEWNFKGSSKNLSLKRAETIKKYLITNGINSERLLPKGLGGIKPIIKNPETMEDGQRNIRVEVVILKS